MTATELIKLKRESISYICTIIDEKTGRYPVYEIGDIYILLNETRYKPIVTLSKYYVFFDVPDKDCMLVIEKKDYYDERKEPKVKDYRVKLTDTTDLQTYSIPVLSVNLKAYTKT